jgi:curved DNA-binding protein CbpA
MSTVNLYDVLNVSQDCSTKELKDAYRELVKIFHPDKPEGDAEMFELITHAYNILVNTTTRKEYDEIYALSKEIETSHFDLKAKSKEYYSALDSDVTKKKKSKDDYKKEFDKVFDDMDRKHGYKRDKDVTIGLSEKDSVKRLRDLQLVRDQDDIENIHDKIFDDGRFDLAKFNAAFDVLHKTQTELIPHNGNPLAYNLDSNISSTFSSIDNYEDLYDDSDPIGNSKYGSIKLEPSKKNKISKDELNKLSYAEYTKNHNFKGKDYDKTIEEKLRERDLETKKLDDRKMNDFDADPSCGGYGIFNQISSNNGNIAWDDGEDIKTRYKRLLEMRKNDLNN